MTTSHASAGKANGGAATVCGEFRNILRPFDAVMQTARSLWPIKTAAEIASRAGLPLRTCEYWLSPKSKNVRSAGNRLLALLRSDARLAIAALGDEACDRIAREYTRQQKLAQLRRDQERQRLNIQQLEQDAAE